jgi:hypothetical protein
VTWRIDVAETARPVLRAMDPSLYLELLEQAASIADHPLPVMTSPLPEDVGSALVYEYESDVIRDLRVRMLFADVDLGERRIVLINVRTISTAPDEPA